MKLLGDKKFKVRVAQIIEHLEGVSSLKEISSLKKLKGFKNAYRIRSGNFRIGFLIEKDTIILGRCLARKDIYKYFP